MRRVALGVALLALGACGHTAAVPDLVIGPCQSAAVTAPIEPEPVGPEVTGAQRLALDVAAIAAVGPDLAAAHVQHTEVDVPARGRRIEARLVAVRAMCGYRP